VIAKARPTQLLPPPEIPITSESHCILGKKAQSLGALERHLADGRRSPRRWQVNPAAWRQRASRQTAGHLPVTSPAPQRAPCRRMLGAHPHSCRRLAAGGATLCQPALPAAERPACHHLQSEALRAAFRPLRRAAAWQPDAEVICLQELPNP
jgi:hypothetical protein